MSTFLRPLVSVTLAVSFAAVVMTLALSCSKRALVQGPPATRAPDSAFILAKDASTANKIVQAFQSSAHEPSKYSLSVANPVKAVQAPEQQSAFAVQPATSEEYYLVSTYGEAPLRNMVLLQSYAVVADKLGVSFDDNTTCGGTVVGGDAATGATNTNNNGKVGEFVSIKGGMIGSVAVDQLRQALRSVNPSLYSVSYFNFQQIDQKLQSRP
jgi:hypothetical protein